MSSRAAIVVTGTEVLSGRVRDRNGPWLADRLTELGVDLAHVTIVGDRPADMRAALDWCAELGVDLVITSGGLGPTADDLTATVVGEFCGREMVLDEELEERIATIVLSLRRRWPHLTDEAIRAANRKQAVVPRGATVIDPVGTAPALVVPPADGREGATVVVLPGPPRELQPMWTTVTTTAAFAAAIHGATAYELRTLRLYGLPESEIATTLREAEREGIALDRIEVTTCVRGGELEIVSRFEPEQAVVYRAFEEVVRARHADTIFSADGSTVDEQVAAMLLEQGLTVAAAESCTGGLVLGRLTERPGSSAYVLGGFVVYANAAKTALAGVPAAMIERHGAVSGEVAAALADGARERAGADIGIGVTGIAGPDGGTPEKPVGTVWIALTAGDGRRIVRLTEQRGSRADVRERSTTAVMHLLRRLLLGASGSGARMRLFVAAELPRDVRGELAQWTRAAVGRGEQPRRIDAASLHITLCFLGEQPPAAVARIAGALGECTELLAAVDDLRIGAPVWLPPRSPRLLAVEIGDPSGALRALHEALARALAATLDWDPGRGRFRPHVTVARLRAGHVGPRARGLQSMSTPTPALCFAPTAATLFRSWLDPGGARYEALASIRL